MQEVSRFFHLPVQTRAEAKTDKTNGKNETYIKDLCGEGIASNHDFNSIEVGYICIIGYNALKYK